MSRKQFSLDTYTPLLESNIKDLPSLNFRSNVVDLSVAVNQISNAMEIRYPITDIPETNRTEFIVRKVSNSYSALKESGDYSEQFSVIAKIGNTLGEQLTGVLNTLKFDVLPIVTKLQEEVEKETSNILDEENLTYINDEDSELNIELRTVSWNYYINMFGGASILADMAQSYLKFKPNLTETNIKELLAHKDFKLLSMQIDPAMKEDMIKRVTNRSKEGAPVEDVFNICFDSFFYNTLIHTIFNEAFESNSYKRSINEIMKAMDIYYPTVRLFKSTMFDMTDETLNEVHQRVDTVLRLFECMAFSMMVYKNHFKKAVLIDSDLLNEDNESAIEEIGKEKLYMFIDQSLNINKRVVPFFGLSKDDITVDLDKVVAAWNTNKATNLRDAKSIKHKVTLKAVNNVLTNYLRNTDESKLSENESLQYFIDSNTQHIKAAIAILDNGTDQNVNSILFDFVIALWYKDGVVKTAHELFGKELVKQLRANPELNDHTTAMVDTAVGANICFSFIMDKLLD